MTAPKTPKTIAITKPAMAIIMDIQAHIFACFDEFAAPSKSPAANFLSTCRANIKEINPCGMQQAKNETTEATIARTRLLGIFEGVPVEGGIHCWDIQLLLVFTQYTPAPHTYICGGG